MNRLEKATSLCMQVVGGISCAASILVVTTILSVPALKKKTYNQYVLYIASANLIGSLGASLGFVKEGTYWCWFQGLTTNYFPLVSLFWTTYLGYMLIQILSGSGRQRMTPHATPNYMPFVLQAFIWVFPAVLTLIPLTTNTYGVYGEDSEYGWCFMEKCSRSTTWSTSFWVIAAFYFWIWAALVVYAGNFIYVYYILTREYAGQIRVVMKTAIHNLGYYLLVVVICWGFAAVYDTLDTFEVLGGFLGSTFSIVCSFVMPLFQGFLTAVVFFCTNTEATAYLKYFISCCTTQDPATALKQPLLYAPTSNSSLGGSLRAVSTEGTALSQTIASSRAIATATPTPSLCASGGILVDGGGACPSCLVSSQLVHLETVNEAPDRDSGSSRVSGGTLTRSPGTLDMALHSEDEPV